MAAGRGLTDWLQERIIFAFDSSGESIVDDDGTSVQDSPVDGAA